MDALQVVIAPIEEIGDDVSVSIYKLPASVKIDVLMAVVAQEPRLKPLLRSGQAKVNGIKNGEYGESLIAIGGYIEPDVFEKIHGVVMSVDGVEFVVGAGQGCELLPVTDMARAGAGAYARSMAASSKPWWKIW